MLFGHGSGSKHYTLHNVNDEPLTRECARFTTWSSAQNVSVLAVYVPLIVDIFIFQEAKEKLPIKAGVLL